MSDDTISPACTSGAHRRCHEAGLPCADSCHAFIESSRVTPKDEGRERIAELRRILRGAA